MIIIIFTRTGFRQSPTSTAILSIEKSSLIYFLVQFVSLDHKDCIVLLLYNLCEIVSISGQFTHVSLSAILNSFSALFVVKVLWST